MLASSVDHVVIRDAQRQRVSHSCSDCAPTETLQQHRLLDSRLIKLGYTPNHEYVCSAQLKALAVQCEKDVSRFSEQVL
jgi:hypothetical protein